MCVCVTHVHVMSAVTCCIHDVAVGPVGRGVSIHWTELLHWITGLTQTAIKVKKCASGRGIYANVCSLKKLN